MKKILVTFICALFFFGGTAVVFGESDYEAGYKWGKKYNITDVTYNDGNTESFNEGVRKYAEDLQDADNEPEEAGGEDVYMENDNWDEKIGGITPGTS